MSEVAEEKKSNVAFDAITKLDLGDKKRVVSVNSNSEWDSWAGHALVDLEAVGKLAERHARVMEAAGKDGEGISYLPFGDGFVELFLKETSIEVTELKSSAAPELGIDDIENYILIGDVVYEMNEDPCYFSENSWVSEVTKVSVFSAIEVWYGKHTGEELWVDIGLQS